MENLLVASDRRDNLAYLSNLVRPDKSNLSGAAAAAVAEFGLGDVLHRHPNELPYGMRRLIAIARAVATEPAILLLDEPAAGTGDSERAELRRLLRRLAGEWNLGILLVEHDVQLVVDVCDRIVAIEFGKVIAEGSPDAVRNDPTVIAAYLGAPPELVAPQEIAHGL
jgi:ABC-type branched-subunit amino acid transport system ATPase component